MVDPQVLQQRGQARLDFGFGQGLAVGAPLQLQHRAHVVFDIELAKDRRFLRQIPQPQAGAAVDGHVFDALAVNGDLAGTGAQQPHDHVKRRGLARAVGPEQADHLAGAHSQRHIAHHLAFAIRALQMLGFEQANGGVARRGRARCLACCGLGHAADAKIHGVLPSGLGVSMARTRPLVVAPGALPSTLNLSVRFS